MSLLNSLNFGRLGAETTNVITSNANKHDASKFYYIVEYKMADFSSEENI